MALRITVPSARRATRWLLGVVLTLVALHLAGQFGKHSGHARLLGFVPLFDLDAEPSVPTWFSSMLLGLSAVLLLAIAAAKWSQHDRYRWHWSGLAALFALLSIDEIAMIHEYPIEPLRESLGAGGPFYYAWVIPGLAFVGALGAVFARFLFALPARVRRQFLLAGAVYVGGSIGVEMLSGIVAERHGEECLAYSLVIALEECLEMCGIVLWIRALLDYLATEVREINLLLSGPTAEHRARGA